MIGRMNNGIPSRSADRHVADLLDAISARRAVLRSAIRLPDEAIARDFAREEFARLSDLRACADSVIAALTGSGR